MTILKKLLLALLASLSVASAHAAAEGIPWDKFPKERVTDLAALQRGAKTFVNYCLSCHSAKFQRYNRMAQDLGMTEDEVKQNLMFTTDKIGDTMNIAM